MTSVFLQTIYSVPCLFYVLLVFYMREALEIKIHYELLFLFIFYTPPVSCLNPLYRSSLVSEIRKNRKELT